MFVTLVQKNHNQLLVEGAVIEIKDKRAYRGLGLLQLVLCLCLILHLAKVGQLATLSSTGQGLLIGFTIFFFLADISIALKRYRQIQGFYQMPAKSQSRDLLEDEAAMDSVKAPTSLTTIWDVPSHRYALPMS